jgi:lysozyme
MSTIHALDISHYQDVHSFNDVRATGVVGIIQKATEGTSYYDPTYADRMSKALDAGLKWSAYHFLRHGSVANQMDWFCAKSKFPKGSRACIDYEQQDVTLDDLQQAIDELIENDPSLQIAIYSGHLLKEQVGAKKYPWLEPHSLWLAQYTTGKPTWPTQIWPTWSLWQFSDKGSVTGISAPVDVNTFNGSKEQCAAWFGPASALVPIVPEAPASVPTVSITVEAPSGVLITVNGIVI